MFDDSTSRYPSGFDVEWIAIDCRGRIAVFTTGAAGPVPRVLLASAWVLDRISDAVSAMPECTDSVLLARAPSPESFESFARRGFFSYDWADVHRTHGRSGLYEVQARPQSPVTYDELAWPEELRPLLQHVTSPSLDFDQPTLDVRELDCEFDPRFGAV